MYNLENEKIDLRKLHLDLQRVLQSFNKYFNVSDFRKLRWVLTNRMLKFFQERSRKDEEKYLKFYDDYGLFFREGIVSTPDQTERVSIVWGKINCSYRTE